MSITHTSAPVATTSVDTDCLACYRTRAAVVLDLHDHDADGACVTCHQLWPCPDAEFAAFILDL